MKQSEREERPKRPPSAFCRRTTSSTGTSACAARRRARGAALRGGLRHPVDARCEPDRSGTSRTRPGSSRPSSSRRRCPHIARSIRRFAFSSTLLQRRRAQAPASGTRDALASLARRGSPIPSACGRGPCGRSRCRKARRRRLALLELGIQHEQQHQELILTDLKHLLSSTRCVPCTASPGRSRRCMRRIPSGSRSREARTKSATTARASRSTTRAPVTRSGWRILKSPRSS
jgi:hypothetical protein